MSATGRGAERRESDYYPSPAWVVRRLLEAVELPGGTWLEPSAGDGAIIRAVNACRSDVRWYAGELRDECGASLRALTPMVRIGDFLADLPAWAAFRCDVAVLNPPFTLAQEFIERCKRLASWVVALERLNFLEGEERNAWLRADAPDVYVIPNRPSFTGEGTDSIAYAWFVWTPERGRSEGRMRLLPLTPANERRTPRLVIPDAVREPQPGLFEEAR